MEPKTHNPVFTTRHFDLIPDESYDRRIFVVGAGAIGSFVVLSLAKMGYRNITVADFDTVEPENIGAQFFNIDSIGKKKVDALADMVCQFTGIQIKTADQKLDENTPVNTDILISAVDNMEVRKMLFDNSAANWLIDPRMGAEYATMETVDMRSKKECDRYGKTLYSNEEAVHERCTAKTTIYTVLLIAGQVVKAVKDITTNQSEKRICTMDWSIRDNAMIAFGEKGKL